MKKISYYCGSLLLASMSIFFACKKEDTGPASFTPSQQKQDDRSGSIETNQIILDVNDFIGNKLGANESGYKLPCGILRVDSATFNGSNKRIYNLFYDNKFACNGRYKKGYVSIQIKKGNNYGEKDSECSITFKDFQVQLADSGQSIALTGTLTLTNVTGGYYWQPAQNIGTSFYKDSVQTSLTGRINITYTSGDIREKNYFQKRTWKSSGGWPGMTMKLSGSSEASVKGSTIKNVYESGKSLVGLNDYYFSFTEDYIWRNCGDTKAGPFTLINGHTTIITDAKLALNSGPEIIDIEAGYKYDGNKYYTPKRTKDCNSNAFKIYYDLSENIQQLKYEKY